MNGNVMKRSWLIGIVWLAFSLPSIGQTPPPNDNFSNRTVLLGNDVAFSGTLAGATLEPGETVWGELTNYGGIDEKQSVWWTWTAPQTSLVTVEMTGASSDSAS